MAVLLSALDEGEVPAALRDRPELFPGLIQVWRAFEELSSTRQIGAMGGRGPIPWTAINDWAKRHQVPDDEFDEFLSFVRAADNAWLVEMAAMDEANRAP